MKQVSTSFLLLAMATSSSEFGVDAFAPHPQTSNTPTTQRAIKVQSSVLSFPTSRVMSPLHFSHDDRNDMMMMMMEQETESVSRELKNPEPFFSKLWKQVSTSQEQSKQLLMAALVFGLTFLPLPSDAAMSGGRMGGSYASPSRSSSVPTRTYSSSRSYYSRPSVTIAPTVGLGGYGYGYGYGGYRPFATPFYGGPGIISYSRGPSFFDLVLLGGFLFAVTSFFRESGSSSIATSDSWSSSSFGSSTSSSLASALGPGTSVAQITVALEVPDRDDPNSILSALDRISRTAKTNSKVGIQNLTSQVALEILRRKSSIVSASTTSKHFRDSNQATRDYQTKAIRERSKFEQETNSQYGGVDYSASRIRNTNNGAGGSKATMAVVTLLLEIQGDSTQLPKANSMTNVEEALRKIASDSKVDDCLQSVEILWTPEDRSETLTRREVIADYPELRSV